MRPEQLFVFVCVLAISTGLFDLEEEEESTISPYFIVSCPDSSNGHLTLKQSSAEVRISSVIPDLNDRQTYCNEGENMLEAPLHWHDRF